MLDTEGSGGKADSLGAPMDDGRTTSACKAGRGTGSACRNAVLTGERLARPSSIGGSVGRAAGFLGNLARPVGAGDCIISRSADRSASAGVNVGTSETWSAIKGPGANRRDAADSSSTNAAAGSFIGGRALNGAASDIGSAHGDVPIPVEIYAAESKVTAGEGAAGGCKAAANSEGSGADENSAEGAGAGAEGQPCDTGVGAAGKFTVTDSGNAGTGEVPVTWSGNAGTVASALETPGGADSSG